MNYTEDFNVCFVFAEIEKKIPQVYHLFSDKTNVNLL